MGKMVDGQWTTDTAYSAALNKKGEFIRGEARVRRWVTADGSSGFPAAKNRYHLFLAYNCPWAHRTAICRNIKNLSGAIGISYANVRRNDDGWWYADGLDEFQPRDGQLPLHKLYSASDPNYTGGVTTPTLWDREQKKVVSNESSEILRMLNAEFQELGAAAIDLYPEPLREEIDAINERIYNNVNNGVYRCGFARSQEAYEEAFQGMFEVLDELDARLDNHRYLAGNQLTEADIRLFPTLVRFDPVYYSHFKCNLRRIVDYPNLSHYLRDLYQTPGFGETVRVDLYKQGYYGRSERLNPSGIIPVGPELNYDAPHNRASRNY